MPANQTLLNQAYGMEIRLARFIREGADQVRIDELREKLDKLHERINKEESNG